MAVRIGFIGTGSMAQTHLERLEQIESAEVVALSDIDPRRLEAVRKRFGGTAYADYHELLEQELLDAVYICVPPFAHLDQEMEAIRRGLHLYVEKPVTLDVELGKQVEQAIRAKGIIAACGYQWRYLDATDRLRSLVEQEPIALAVGCWYSGLPEAPWWRNRFQSGGQLVEQTTHLVDLARYLLGEVVEVGAYGTQGLIRDLPGYNTEDASVAMLKFQSGAVGAFLSSCLLLTQGQGAPELTLLGRDLRVDFGFDRVRIERASHAEEFIPQGDAYLKASQAFIEAVASGDASPIRSSYADGLITAQVTLAASHAMRTGQTVRLKGAG